MIDDPNSGNTEVVLGADGRHWAVSYTLLNGVQYGYPLSETDVAALRHTARHHPGTGHRPLHHAAHIPQGGHSSRIPKAGINSWTGEAVTANDGMASNPLAQAVFHGNTGRAAFYYAPFQVAAFASGPLAIACFLSPFLPATMAATTISWYLNPQAFDSAALVLHDFLFGSSNRHRLYLQD